MSYTVEDYVKNYQKDFLQELSVEERLADLPSDVVLQRFSPDQRLHGLAPDQRLHGLSPDEIEAYLAKLKSQRPH
jgi:hypothetical protein